ncbi:ParA family protein [Salisaeta longa]|uniref:ParA family protein n=1 Tax=Salisaeta longa TaxID=503170 RepID=UPI0003B41C0E|nr:ParA family protein [Salisaeta longa]
MTIIPIINNKGGVGKTTTTVNIAAGLGRQGQRVLLVDLDSQASASLALGVSRDNLRPSVAEVLFDETSTGEAIRSTSERNVDLITGALRLADADTRLSRVQNRQARLLNVLESVTDRYDYVLVDCPPSTSLLTINALVAADAFLIPASPSYLSLEGVVSLGKVVSTVRRELGEAAPVLGVLLTMVREGDAQAQENIEAVREHYGGKVFNTEIHHDPPLEEAPEAGQSIFRFAPDTRGAREYSALVDEVIDRVDRYSEVYESVNERKRKRASA